MKKSLHINFRAHFGQPTRDFEVYIGKPRLYIRHAEKQYFYKLSDWAIIQEFDGRYGYLYCYEVSLQQQKSITIRIKKNDLHVLYLMQGQQVRLLPKNESDDIILLSAQRARYIYLPKGQYTLVLPKGKSLLFGFYFDAMLFRRNYELQFNFLQTVLHAYRQHTCTPVASIDFTVAERTHAYIEQLCDSLTHIDLENEGTILTHLIALIKLSKEKVFDEYQAERADKKLATKVHELLLQTVEHRGQECSLQELARVLDRHADYLNQIHKLYYGCSLKALKEKALITKAKKLLPISASISACAYDCGYNSVGAFTRFFRQQTGKSPSEFLSNAKNSIDETVT